MNSPRLWISFEDRVGFVFDVSGVIFAWRLNIVAGSLNLEYTPLANVIGR